MAKLTPNDTCPCLSGKKFDACCQPLHQGTKKAETAEELMRARYSAFVAGNIDFILSSHHSKTVEQVKREEVESWSKDSSWKGLSILQTEGGLANDSTGSVTFEAKYVFDGELQNHFEKALFHRENGEWKFFDAESLENTPYVREEPKIGRNDPCHCGSGKKYKKCHALSA